MSMERESNEMIKQTLDEFNAYALKMNLTDREWTIEIKNRICKIGKERGYEVRASSSEEAHSAEWLYDVIWRKMSGNKVVDVGLVLESQWDRSGIVDDFQKLLLARAELRCMIFCTASKQSAEVEIGELINQVGKFSGTQPSDKYLFCAWLADEKHFYFHDYAFDRLLSDFCDLLVDSSSRDFPSEDWWKARLVERGHMIWRSMV